MIRRQRHNLINVPAYRERILEMDDRLFGRAMGDRDVGEKKQPVPTTGPMLTVRIKAFPNLS